MTMSLAAEPAPSPSTSKPSPEESTRPSWAETEACTDDEISVDGQSLAGSLDEAVLHDAGCGTAKATKRLSSASLGISDIELLDEEKHDDDNDGHGASHAGTSKPRSSSARRLTSSLRSSLLSSGRNRASQKSLRWSTRLSIDLGELGTEDRDPSSEEANNAAAANHLARGAAPSEETTSEPRKKTVKTVTAQNAPVFFMIGCQRSGSNWLRTMLSEREDLIAPHPPHIVRDFMPRLARYGDLTVQKNLKVLIDHVCAFTERNQVQWLDLHSRPIKFNRPAILMEVMLTINCYHFKEKYTAMQEGREVPEHVDPPYYLLAVFDAIMNTMTKANGKKIWMCKSMGMSQHHDLLLSFYGKERLRYIYLVRDPRDVCLSFIKTPVGDCHPYTIAKKWARLQNFAARVLHETPELIHQVCYEEVLGNKGAQVAKIVEFMGARDVCRSMRRGSIVAIKNEKDVVKGAKKGREAKSARRLSCQFKNLMRGDSFIAGQFMKWKREMSDEDMAIVESVAFEEMKRLGYEPHAIETEEDRIHFTGVLCEEYAAENERLVEKMNADLAVKNPDDLKRRQIQAAVLEKTTSEHYDEAFVESFSVDIDDALDAMDEESGDKGFLVKDDAERFDFHEWPMNASMVGFQPGDKVSERFEMQNTQTLKLEGGISVTFAVASQGGYYPGDQEKAIQDTYIAGASVCEAATSKSLFKRKRKETAVLFSVFDGHGPDGANCARLARQCVLDKIENELKDETDHLLDESVKMSSSFRSAYCHTSSLLETGADGVDASHSGTTATSLVITEDFLHTANVGDSRCLLIEHDPRLKEPAIKSLTLDHTPDREDEIARIEACGGVVMSSDQYDLQDPNFTSFEQKRIWSKCGKWPGTAFTRSIGDAVAKGLGVVADPECSTYDIPSSDATFVLGSDGVFDFVTDEEIGAIVRKYKDPSDACRELVGKAFNRWCDSEERTDDITVIVGHVKHSRRGILGKLRRPFAKSA